MSAAAAAALAALAVFAARYVVDAWAALLAGALLALLLLAGSGGDSI